MLQWFANRRIRSAAALGHRSGAGFAAPMQSRGMAVSGRRSEGFGVARNSAVLAAANIVALAIAFGTTLLITGQLGTDRYGLFIGAQRFVGFFAVFAYFGMHPLLVRATATRSEDAGVLLGTILVLRVALAGVFGLLVWIGAAATHFLPGHGWLLLGVAFVQIPLSLAEVLAAVCEGRERMGRVAWISLIRTLTTFLCICAAVLLDRDLGYFVAAYVVGAFAELAAAALFTRGVIPGLRLRVRFDRLMPILEAAVPFVVIGLGFAAIRSLDVVILARFSTIPEVSRYGAALNFTDMITMLAVLVQRALFPVFSRLQLTNAANDLASNSLSLSLAVLIPASVGLALLADSAVGLYPSGGFDAAAPVLMILCAGLVCLGPGVVCASFLTGAARLRPIIGAYAFALPVQGAASLLLVTEHAAVGVAIGTLLGYTTFTALLLRSACGLGIWIDHRMILRQLMATALMALVVAASRDLPFAIPVILGLVSYAGALGLIAPVDSPERHLVAALVSRRR
jgi:O-antigen/teichoic acid export membrane protein